LITDGRQSLGRPSPLAQGGRERAVLPVMTICKWCLAGYGLVALLALAAIPMSAIGWIAPDPLSAVPAILVGAPWSFLLVSLDVADSVALNVLLVALAMLINGTLIFLPCRLITRWRSD
jgi:hypothetical protein